MAIPFTCTCGKAMKAKDDFAGRKIKCPGCGMVVRIPRAERHEEMPPGFLSIPQEPAKPMANVPLAKPVLAQPNTAPTSRPVHAWEDQSLTQQPTPWLRGDEARFQKGIKAPAEGMSSLEKSGFVILILGGIGMLVFVLLMNS